MSVAAYNFAIGDAVKIIHEDQIVEVTGIISDKEKLYYIDPESNRETWCYFNSIEKHWGLLQD